MIDFSNLTNVSGNAMRGFSGGSGGLGVRPAAPSPALGSAPLNLLPSAGGMQPGNNGLQGLLQLIQGAFQQSGLPSSFASSPMGQIFGGASAAPAAPPASGFASLMAKRSPTAGGIY